MNSYVCFFAMLAGVKKRMAHHHQAYLSENILLKLLYSLLRIPYKMFATHWLACGEAAAINGWGKGAVKKGEVMILPNAVDPEQFKFNETARREVRAKYGIRDDEFVIGHVGRFYPQKNHEFLIEIFAKLHKQKANIKLLLLGDGPLQKHINQKVASLGLSNTVIFAGLQKDSAPFYSAMDVFAFPSLWEGLPLTLVEAQYSGLPCVISNNVTKEVVVSESCVVVKEFSLDLWVKSLMKLPAMGRKNSVYLSNFDVKKTFSRLKELYEEL